MQQRVASVGYAQKQQLCCAVQRQGRVVYNIEGLVIVVDQPRILYQVYIIALMRIDVPHRAHVYLFENLQISSAYIVNLEVARFQVYVGQILQNGIKVILVTFDVVAADEFAVCLKVMGVENNARGRDVILQQLAVIQVHGKQLRIEQHLDIVVSVAYIGKRYSGVGCEVGILVCLGCCEIIQPNYQVRFQKNDEVGAGSREGGDIGLAEQKAFNLHELPQIFIDIRLAESLNLNQDNIYQWVEFHVLNLDVKQISSVARDAFGCHVREEHNALVCAGECAILGYHMKFIIILHHAQNIDQVRTMDASLYHLPADVEIQGLADLFDKSWALWTQNFDEPRTGQCNFVLVLDIIVDRNLKVILCFQVLADHG